MLICIKNKLVLDLINFSTRLGNIGNNNNNNKIRSSFKFKLGYSTEFLNGFQID